MSKINSVLRTRFGIPRASAVLALVLVGAFLLSNSGGRFGRTVQASAPPLKAWSQNYGSYSTDERAYSLVQTSDGGYALAGTIYSYPNPPVGYHGLLVKTDSNGSLQWNRTYGGSGEDQIRSVVQTGDGGYALAGYSNSFSSSNGFDFWLVKTNSSGNQLWSKTYPSNGTYGTVGVQDYAYSVVQTYDGGYALAGYSVSYGVMFVMTNSTGDLLKEEFYGIPTDRVYSMIRMLNGGYALSGNGFWILDSAGSLVLEAGIQDSEVIYAYSIAQTSDGGWACAGDKRSLHVGNDIFLTKAGTSNPYGHTEWNNTYGGDNDDSCNSLVQTSDSGYALGGRTKSYGAGNWDFYLVKTNPIGEFDWQETFGGALDDGAYCVIETSDGGLALAGYSQSYTNGGYDMWLVKLSVFLPPPYSVTIWSWDSIHGWLTEPIIQTDGVPAGINTPHTFSGLFGTHNFTVPNTDAFGNPFGKWYTGETTPTLTVSSNGIFTAQYGPPYNVTIQAWDNTGVWLNEPITMDGVSSGFSTPHNFTGLIGTHNFTVPDTDTLGNPFANWTTGSTGTLDISSGGTYTAQYYYNIIPEFTQTILLAVIFIAATVLTLVSKKAHVR